MFALRALRAALRVYAVGVAVMLSQLLRRLRGGFRPPGESHGAGAGSAWGRRGRRECAGTPKPHSQQLAELPAGNRKYAWSVIGSSRRPMRARRGQHGCGGGCACADTAGNRYGWAK